MTRLETLNTGAGDHNPETSASPTARRSDASNVSRLRAPAIVRMQSNGLSNS
jgi:hypothetical protein